MVYPIVLGAVDNVFAVLNTLDDFRHILYAHMPSWPTPATWRVRLIDGAISVASRTLLLAVDTAWCGRFAARVVWVVWSIPTR